MIIIPCILMMGRLIQYKTEDAVLDQVSEITAKYVIPEADRLITDVQNQESLIEPEDYIDISAMKAENQDLAGYIRIDDTPVDYPIMRSEESDKYLRRDFYGNRSAYGCIYMDNASYAGGMNLLLYGHNMKSGKMFGQIDLYENEEFMAAHPYIKYIDETGISVYEVIGYFIAGAKDKELLKVLVPYTQEEAEGFLEYVKQHGKLTQDFAFGDNLITLGTCEYTHKNGRLFVIGKRKEFKDWRNQSGTETQTESEAASHS